MERSDFGQKMAGAAQVLKRFDFRRGDLPMGDTHEILARVRSRIDEMDERLVKKYRLTLPPVSDSELHERISKF